MITKHKLFLDLSCNTGGPECFLSCSLFPQLKIPSNPNLNQKRNLKVRISCAPSNHSESGNETPSDYSAIGLILGIDPGLSGALAFITNEPKPKFIAVYDFPIKKVKDKNRIDLEVLSFLISSYSKDINLAMLEEVGLVGTKADPFSSFVFGFATGAVHGVLAAFDVSILTIKPLAWKSSMGLDSSKEKSIEKAIKLFPESAKHLTRKKDHDRAEAILLAYFAWKLGARK